MTTPLTATELKRLHQTYADGLCRYFWAATRQQADAEDLVQDYFVKLARQGTWLAAVENEPAWIFAVARNLLLDWKAKSVRQGIPATTDDPEHETQKTASLLGSDAAFLGAELQAAMASLPLEQRQVVQLRLWEELSLRQIADSQSIPLQTAASRLRYGLATLRTRLQNLYTEMK